MSGGNGVRQNENDSETSRKPRKPVKLTMKQGLTMNQVIATYALSDVKNALCKNHTEEFKRGLRALEPWALQMFDSSSKVASGILNGNLAEYGAYKQCLNVYEDTEYGPIRGRHCSFRVTPTEKLLSIVLGFRNVSAKRFDLLKKSVMEGVKLIWSVCVPDSCHFEDVFPHFNKSIAELTEGLDLVVTLKKEYCISLDDEPKLDTPGYIAIFIIGLIILTVAISTIIDAISEGESSWLINSFSAYSNGKRLFSTEAKELELECLNGFRYVSICYVVIGHRYIHNMVFPSANSVDLVYWVQRYFSTLVMGGTVSVDTFFLISSTLLSYHFFLTVTKTNSFNLIHFYLYRNIRIIMPLSVTTAIYATLLHYLGSGPSWHDYAYVFQKPCQVFWWSTLINLQSYANPETICIVQVWYLTDDMIFYYLSPIITIPLWKWPKFGYVNLVLVYILSIVSSFWVAWSNKFDGGMPITSRLLDTKYFHKHYVAPHARASPYIIGLAFGYALFKTRGRRIRINLVVNILGWTLSSAALLSVVLAAHVFHEENYTYNRLFSSLFLSCSRSVWTFGVMWIIFCCVNGKGGPVNVFLAHPVFKVLGRTAYSVYLLHYGFQSAMSAARKVPHYFSDFLTLYMACSDIVLMTLLGIPFSLCFEYPFVGMASLLMKKSGKSRKVLPENMKEKSSIK
ncbi:O-acyltransferase like protein-like [Anoplophora glabripennis]|uniref:O-acyltransferase like protein-like n=1 Tax=Anoplophora glabripennis TaxID=217634 RepID=UPI0008745086|nr:O-acyltransferase like protein-like [Anoplophora glabripennis]